MFKYTSLKEQLIEERRKNAALKEQTEKNTSYIDYIAMMTDVEFPESEEMEVDENEQ